MKTYLDHVIEQELKSCTPEELMAARDRVALIKELHTYPHVERRHYPQRYRVLNDRRRSRRAPTRRTMVTITGGMLGVSIISWVLAANEIPQALYMVPFYFFYVAVILVIKAVRLRRWVRN